MKGFVKLYKVKGTNENYMQEFNTIFRDIAFTSGDGETN
jgi:hypothetical protein